MKEYLSEVGGIKCTKTIIYRDVKMTLECLDHVILLREQIEKIFKVMRGRILNADPDSVKLFMFAWRGPFRFTFYLLAAVGHWMREYIDNIEANFYRKVIPIGNDLPNTSILNTITNV
jgi:hypothetical protein